MVAECGKCHRVKEIKGAQLGFGLTPSLPLCADCMPAELKLPEKIELDDRIEPPRIMELAQKINGVIDYLKARLG